MIQGDGNGHSEVSCLILALFFPIPLELMQSNDVLQTA